MFWSSRRPRPAEALRLGLEVGGNGAEKTEGWRWGVTVFHGTLAGTGSKGMLVLTKAVWKSWFAVVFNKKRRLATSSFRRTMAGSMTPWQAVWRECELWNRVLRIWVGVLN